MKIFHKLICIILFTIISQYALATGPTIYLDFDGETVTNSAWNGGLTFICSSSGLTALQEDEIFNRVSADYSPFDVLITIDESDYLSAPVLQRTRIIVTSSSSWYASGVGGVAYTGSFTWGNDIPAFVFADRLTYTTKYVSEACSHESGHTLGLSHQSLYDENCNLVQPYYEGSGIGEIAWAPIMGNSYYRNMSTWHNGATPYGCSLLEDELPIIVSTANGINYRADDHSNTFAGATSVISKSRTKPKAINIGIIETSTDVDMFTFFMRANVSMNFTVNPENVGVNNNGANLDIQVTLYDDLFNTVGVYNPSSLLNSTVNSPTLNIDSRYYIEIKSTGNANCSGYGSIGTYSFQLTVPCAYCRESEKASDIVENQDDKTSKPDLIRATSDGHLIINSNKIYACAIYTFDGRLVYKNNLQVGQNQLNVPAGLKGGYIIKYFNKTNTWTDKILLH